MDLNIAQKRRGVVTQGVTPTKGNHKRKRVYIPRRTRKFQLRNSHPQDMHVAEILDYARAKRQEVTMIRNAVQLEYSLGQGDLSILLERFPWVKEALSPPPPVDNSNLVDEIAALRKLILEQGAAIPPMKPNELQMQSSSGAGQLTTKSFALPAFDDDDDLPTLKLSKNTNNDSIANFLKGVMSLQ